MFLTYSTSFEFSLLWALHDGTVIGFALHGGGKKHFGGACSRLIAVLSQA
jgi:hypothetical protein